MSATKQSRPPVSEWARGSFHVAAKGSEGQALVEFALMVPLIFLLIVNAINFGAFIGAWITIADAARAAANYGVIGTTSPGSPSSPTTAQITTLINNATASLPNTVSTCVNRNATASAVAGTCSFTISPIPADPEGSPYISLAVDVNYPFAPPVPAFNFPGFGIYTTLPPTSIHRRALMRVFN